MGNGEPPTGVAVVLDGNRRSRRCAPPSRRGWPPTLRRGASVRPAYRSGSRRGERRVGGHGSPTCAGRRSSSSVEGAGAAVSVGRLGAPTAGGFNDQHLAVYLVEFADAGRVDKSSSARRSPVPGGGRAQTRPPPGLADASRLFGAGIFGDNRARMLDARSEMNRSGYELKLEVIGETPPAY